MASHRLGFFAYYGVVTRSGVREARDAANRQGVGFTLAVGIAGLGVYWVEQGWSKAVDHLAPWLLHALIPMALVLLLFLLWHLVQAPVRLARKQQERISATGSERDALRGERDAAIERLDLGYAPTVNFTGGTHTHYHLEGVPPTNADFSGSGDLLKPSQAQLGDDPEPESEPQEPDS